MSSFVVTNKGLALLAKLTQGTTLEITGAKTGAGTVAANLLKEQTGVTTPKQNIDIQSVSYPGGQDCDIVLSLSNKGLTASYSAYQVGIYANDPDEGEVLYAIYQAGSGEQTTIHSEAVMPGYNAEWKFRIRYDQADIVNVTVDPANSVTRAGMEDYVGNIINPFTTAGTSEAYTVTVPSITELKAGVCFKMIPHITSTTATPTLNVNGLGAKNLRQPLTSNSGATTAAELTTWLTAGKPVLVMYDGTLWKTISLPRPSAEYLYGSVPIKHGGTDATDAATALYNLGILIVTYGTEDGKASHSAIEISDAVDAGKLVIGLFGTVRAVGVTIYKENGVAKRASFNSSICNLVYNQVSAYAIRIDAEKNYTYETVQMYTAPAPTEADYGKVLTVDSEGHVVWGDYPTASE